MPDPVVTPVAIKIIFDLFDKLVAGKSASRKELFTDIAKPLYDQLMTVHENYHQMFLKATRSLPYKVGDDWTVPGNHLISSTLDEVDACIKQVKRDFREWRKDKEPIRDKVRYDAAQFFSAVNGAEEKRFLLSIILYFLEENVAQDGDSFQDQRIELIVEKGGIRALDTPSSRLCNEISAETDAEKLREILEEARNLLNSRFAFASARFNQLRIKIQG